MLTFTVQGHKNKIKFNLTLSHGKAHDIQVNTTRTDTSLGATGVPVVIFTIVLITLIIVDIFSSRPQLEKKIKFNLIFLHGKAHGIHVNTTKTDIYEKKNNHTTEGGRGV